MTRNVVGMPVERPAGGPAARDTVAGQVYRQLRDGLMSGRFQPGQKLTIRGLAADLGSSPMPVREALQRLHAENAIELAETGRARVTRLGPDQVREVRDARVALEGLLAEQAATRITPSDLKDIRAIYERMSAAVAMSDQAAYLWANFAFHRRIYQVARAELTLSVVEQFWLLVGPCFTLLTPDREHLERSMLAHSRILAALVDRDGAAAKAATAEDIMQAAGSLSAQLAQAERLNARR